jgi:excisionase family DNA binding protein
MNEAQTIASEHLSGSAEYFSVAELAAMLKLHEQTIRLWIRQDRLPTRKDGRRYLVKGDDVARLLAAEPLLGIPHRPAQQARRQLEATVDAAPRPQETGRRALATGLLQKGLS